MFCEVVAIYGVVRVSPEANSRSRSILFPSPQIMAIVFMQKINNAVPEDKLYTPSNYFTGMLLPRASGSSSTDFNVQASHYSGEA